MFTKLQIDHYPILYPDFTARYRKNIFQYKYQGIILSLKITCYLFIALKFLKYPIKNAF